MWGIAVFVSAFLFIAGLALTHTLSKCVMNGGSAEWESYIRNVLLLICLPLALFGLKRPAVTSLLLFCGAMVAIVLAILQRTWAPNFVADATIGILIFLIALQFHARLKWIEPQAAQSNATDIE